MRITVAGGKVWIKFSPALASTIERVKLVPGRRWSPDEGAWHAPASVMVIAAVDKLFGVDQPETNEAYRALLGEARRAEAAQAHKTADVLPQPALNKLPLWKHQLRGYHFALPLHSVMLDMRMGTGKSAVIVNLIINRGHRRVLIVAPKTVIDGDCVLEPGGNLDSLSVWAREFYRHAAHLKWRCWNDSRGTCADRAKKMQDFIALCECRGDAAIVLMNYEAAWRPDMARAIAHARFDFVVCDESHKIKSPSGSASKFFERLGPTVPWRACLTGTPTPHSPLDLFAQYRFLDKGAFGSSFTLFRAKYAVMGGYGGHEVKGYQNLEEYRDRMDRLAYHCGDEVLDLPETVHTYRTVELDPKTMRTYAQMEKTFVADLDAGRVTASNALSKMLRLQQITSGYLPIDEAGGVAMVGTEKRSALEDVFEDIAAAEPVVVFARFRHDLDQIREAAERCGRSYAELSGRGNALKLWQDGGANVLGVQIQAGGVGISLVRARYCVYYSMGYSLGDYEQSLARTHRPGQKRSVAYIHLIARDTIDQRVYDALHRRAEVIEEILHGYKKGR